MKSGSLGCWSRSGPAAPKRFDGEGRSEPRQARLTVNVEVKEQPACGGVAEGRSGNVVDQCLPVVRDQITQNR